MDMKNHGNNYSLLKYSILIVAIINLVSCSNNNWILPPEYAGHWKTDKTKITVRTQPKFGKFQFTSDSAIIMIRINNDRTVSGFIGSALFENGKLLKNSGNPDKTGVSYKIECRSIGKIFNLDPKESKEVEIWLGPVNANGSIDAEIRYTQGMAVFPMAGMLFTKVKD
jgi:hypothetical protein